MSSIDLSTNLWVDPLVAACILAALYAPLKDFFRSRTKSHKERQSKLDQMLGDWVGEPSRPGFDAVPGIPERVHRLEADVSTIRHEVQFNSGHSIKDAVHQTNDTIATVKESLDAHIVQSTVIQGEIFKKLGGQDAV